MGLATPENHLQRGGCQSWMPVVGGHLTLGRSSLEAALQLEHTHNTQACLSNSSPRLSLPEP